MLLGAGAKRYLIAAVGGATMTAALICGGQPATFALSAPVGRMAITSPPVKPDCRATTDIRGGTRKDTPFTVCGIPVISMEHRVSAAYLPQLVTVPVARSGVRDVRLQRPVGEALVQLVKAAKQAGHTLEVRSAYRSYEQQRAAYQLDRALTAPPGASEHQSGLSVDLSAISCGRAIRGYSFGSSAAGRWTARHAAEYGFIVRYPAAQKAITGFSHEPWHLRWVGVQAANGVLAVPTGTLERYLRIG